MTHKVALVPLSVSESARYQLTLRGDEYWASVSLLLIAPTHAEMARLS